MKTYYIVMLVTQWIFELALNGSKRYRAIPKVAFGNSSERFRAV